MNQVAEEYKTELQHLRNSIRELKRKYKKYNKSSNQNLEDFSFATIESLDGHTLQRYTTLDLLKENQKSRVHTLKQIIEDLEEL